MKKDVLNYCNVNQIFMPEGIEESNDTYEIIKNIITQLKKYYKDWQMLTYKKATYISQENKYQRYTYCTKSNAIQPN